MKLQAQTVKSIFGHRMFLMTKNANRRNERKPGFLFQYQGFYFFNGNDCEILRKLRTF